MNHLHVEQKLWTTLKSAWYKKLQSETKSFKQYCEISELWIWTYLWTSWKSKNQKLWTKYDAEWIQRLYKMIIFLPLNEKCCYLVADELWNNWCTSKLLHRDHGGPAEITSSWIDIWNWNENWYYYNTIDVMTWTVWNYNNIQWTVRLYKFIFESFYDDMIETLEQCEFITFDVRRDFITSSWTTSTFELQQKNNNGITLQYEILWINLWFQLLNIRCMFESYLW